MKKRIALLAAITLLAGICTVPVSASVTVTPQSDVLVRYDFEADGASGVFASKGTLSNDVRADGDNKVQRVQNSGGNVTSANDTMFNLAYIPEVMEISYDLKLKGYSTGNVDETAWFSTYLKVGTGNGDEENFYARHRFPKFFARKGAFYYKVAGGDANVVSSTGVTYSTANEAWSTVIIRINNKTKTSEVFAKAQGSTEETKLGESKNIEIKTNTFGMEMCMNNAARVELYLDNFTVRDITPGTSLSIGSLSADNGLTASVKVPSNASRAELLSEGTKIADLDASSSKIFNITAPASDVIKKLGTERFELVCYNASNEVIDRVAVYKEVSKQVYNTKNTLPSYDFAITTDDSATAVKKVWPSIMSTERVVNKTTKLSFDIAKTSEINMMGFRLNTKGVNDEWKAANNKPVYLSDQYIIADKSIYTDTILDTNDMTLNTKYHVDVVFNPNTVKINYTITSGGEEKAHFEMPFTRSGTTVACYGLESMEYYYEAQIGGSGAFSITDMSFSHLEDMEIPSVSAFVTMKGESGSTADGNVPASAKSVSADVSAFSGIDAANVKLYKDGAEVSGASAALADGTLTVTDETLSAGTYTIEIPQGAIFGGEALSYPVAIAFEVYNTDGYYFGDIDMQKDGAKVTSKVFCKNFASDALPAALITAVYDGDRMTAIDVSKVNSVSGTGYLETEVSYSGATEAKSFVWKSLDSAEPYGIEKSISLAQPTE